MNTSIPTQVRLTTECCSLPERLLLAHGRGEVLFIAGAGISRPSGLPLFRGLALDVYERVELATHAFLATLAENAPLDDTAIPDTFNTLQRAEIKRFVAGDYDIVLGMLERRVDDVARGPSTVRRAVIDSLNAKDARPADIHRSMIKLSDRGGSIAIVTTNFDWLLETAARNQKISLRSYSIEAIPRPSRRAEFAGVFHIHGMLPNRADQPSDFIISEQDFGEYYLRRRSIPDFIYDAARLFHLVLVGYSANDAPMQYLLNAVAADSSRFVDLKERFSFVACEHLENPDLMADWRGRGITPIPYSAVSGHQQLGLTLGKWAEFSAHNGDKRKVDALLKRLVKRARTEASEDDRNLFDFLVRRVSPFERIQIAKMVSEARADISWLDPILDADRAA